MIWGPFGLIESGGGGGGNLTLTDEAGSVSGAVNTLVVPTGTATVDGTTGYIRALPNNGANFTSTLLSTTDLVMALTMNESSSPIRDVSKLDGYLTAQGGTPLYEETGYFPSGTAIKLGRSNGCLFKYSNALIAPNTSTIGDGHTVSFVAKPVDKTAGNNGYYFSFYNGASDNYHLITTTTNIALIDNNGGVVLSANIDFADLETAPYNIDIFDGDFHLFTCVREHDGTGRHLYFYIDGQLVAENNDAEPLESYGLNTTQIGIAGYIGSASAAAVLTCDEFVMSSTPWTGSMVGEHWNGGDILSFATSEATTYGFLEATISDFNSNIFHVWKMDEAVGNTAADYAGLTSVTTSGAGITRGVTGRWPGTLATEISNASNSRFERLNSFNGPDPDTPWAMSMDVEFVTGHSGGNAGQIIELGYANSNYTGANRTSIGATSANILYFTEGGNGPGVDISSVIGDGDYHTLTCGRRYESGVEYLFIALDGVIASTARSWCDLSDEALDLAIGETLNFNSYTGNKPLHVRVQNIVLWNNVSFEDAHIAAVNEAQLVEIS